jgi:hypothetical protein
MIPACLRFETDDQLGLAKDTEMGFDKGPSFDSNEPAICINHFLS